MRYVFLFLPLVTLAACNKPDSDQAKPAVKPVPEAQGTAAAVKPAAVGTATATAVVAAPAAPNLPARPGRSAMPTLAEWNTQQKEVTVKGSTALNCETKIVREYLRVSCKGKNDSGGTPTDIIINKGGHGETYTYVNGGITSLVVPFVEGINFEAYFGWTDKGHDLAISWPRGSKQPDVVGVFKGAKSPLTSHDKSPLADKLCGCHKKVTNSSTCDNLVGSPDVDCDRTYGNDCEKLLQCSRSEPGVAPNCLPGWINAYQGRCFQQCTDGKTACPAKHHCGDFGDVRFCVEDD